VARLSIGCESEMFKTSISTNDSTGYSLFMLSCQFPREIGGVFATLNLDKVYSPGGRAKTHAGIQAPPSS